MLLLLAWSLAARADVALDPPDTCPQGSVPTSSHSYAWCAATSCETGETCPEGQECREYPLCVDTFEMPCGGMVEDSAEPCTFTVHEATGPCAGDGSCTRGVCETATRCVHPSVVDEGDGPCGGCDGGATGAGLAALGALVLLALGRSRR